MAGRGRGRGRGQMTFNVEAVGIGKGDALPPPTLQPSPLFPVSPPGVRGSGGPSGVEHGHAHHIRAPDPGPGAPRRAPARGRGGRVHAGPEAGAAQGDEGAPLLRQTGGAPQRYRDGGQGRSVHPDPPLWPWEEQGWQWVLKGACPNPHCHLHPAAPWPFQRCHRTQPPHPPPHQTGTLQPPHFVSPPHYISPSCTTSCPQPSPCGSHRCPRGWVSPADPQSVPTLPPAVPTDIERYSDKYQLSSPVDSAIDWNPGEGTREAT